MTKKILAIDFGLKKVGLAIADTDSKLSRPLTVLRAEKADELLEKVRRLIKSEEADEIVVGVSEGHMGSLSRKFGEDLAMNLGIKVNFIDETLTTHDAQELSILSGKSRKRRKEMEDAYSAALILDSFFRDLQI